ncbi:MAG: hypothetical protein WAV38_28525 [Xanthobacteraceae bacterium]
MLATVESALAELEEEEELIELAPGEISLDFLRRIYRGTQQPMSLRMRAAIEALPFEKPKLSATAIATMDGKTFAEALERCIERSRNPPMLNPPKTIEHEELVSASELKEAIRELQKVLMIPEIGLIPEIIGTMSVLRFPSVSDLAQMCLLALA